MELGEHEVSRVVQEFADVELGDARRTKRLCQVVEALARHPNWGLPSAMGTDAALRAAYRLANNTGFDFDDVLAEHVDRTIGRAEQAREVWAIHDTTTCSFPHADPRDVGFLATGKAGFLAHITLIVDAERYRRPLGVVHMEALWRNQRSGRGSRKRHISGKEMASWTGRESERWVRGVQHCQEQLSNCSVIHVMDREGDKYELVEHMLSHEERFVLRSRYDRTLVSEPGEATKLQEAMALRPLIFKREVYASRKPAKRAPNARSLQPSRLARTAVLKVSAAPLVLRRPRTLATKFSPTCAVNVVHIEEIDPPAGQKAISWTLLTSESIQTPRDIERVIDIYRHRWLIEELFKALKTGCSAEGRMFESRHPLLNMTAILLPIAVELLWMRARVADDPNAPCSDIVSPTQLQILQTMGNRPLPKSPTACDVLLAIASLGGHLKRNGAPGWQVLHRGLQRLIDYEAGWRARARDPTRLSKREKM